MKPYNEQYEIDNDLKNAEESQKLHLSKFEDMEALLVTVDHFVQSYFKQQNTYTDIEEFKQHITKSLNFYVDSFSMKRPERRRVRNQLSQIENSYSEIIYFGEKNVITAREERVSKKVGDQVGEYVGKVDNIL